MCGRFKPYGGGNTVSSQPNPTNFMKNIHNRMPVILDDEKRMRTRLEDKTGDLKRFADPYHGDMAAEPFTLRKNNSYEERYISYRSLKIDV